MSDEQELKERERTYIEDRKNQAKWYESLNLYAEAMKIYRNIDDEENIKRLSITMNEEYAKNAKDLERRGKFQEAANLYYLIGDKGGVGRMKKLKPDLIIVYDEEGGGLAQVVKKLGSSDEEVSGDEYFTRPNPSEDFEVVSDENGEGMVVKEESEDEDVTPMGRKGVTIKMPKSMKKMRFCPYCGERINTKNPPKFCPFCGDEVA
jgi:hypothetical protein